MKISHNEKVMTFYSLHCFKCKFKALKTADVKNELENNYSSMNNQFFNLSICILCTWNMQAFTVKVPHTYNIKKKILMQLQYCISWQ